jgi:hypothetical protein
VFADDLLFDESAFVEPTAGDDVHVHVAVVILGLYVVGVDDVDVLATFGTGFVGVCLDVHIADSSIKWRRI